jgi:NAD(P)-dependent dehydrogenase (short-subunit alcohol dehydrogenase family)
MSTPKVALVTAASSGLGAAIARMLAVDLGMNVVINFNSNESRANELVQTLQTECDKKHAESNISIQAIQADTCDKLQIKSLVDKAASKFGGRLDVVISNVGWTKVRQFSDIDDNIDEDDWDRCYVANVKSHLWLFHAAKRYLEESNKREAGVPVFVSTASLAGVIPSGSSVVCTSDPGKSSHSLTIAVQPYAVTKAAQIHLGKCLAKIAAPSVRVNTISPGILLTVCEFFPRSKDAISFCCRNGAFRSPQSDLKRLVTRISWVVLPRLKTLRSKSKLLSCRSQ